MGGSIKEEEQLSFLRPSGTCGEQLGPGLVIAQTHKNKAKIEELL